MDRRQWSTFVKTLASMLIISHFNLKYIFIHSGDTLIELFQMRNILGLVTEVVVS